MSSLFELWTGAQISIPFNRPRPAVGGSDVSYFRGAWLATALCLARWDDVQRLAPAASAEDKQFGLVLAALKGQAEAVAKGFLRERAARWEAASARIATTNAGMNGKPRVSQSY